MFESPKVGLGTFVAFVFFTGFVFTGFAKVPELSLIILILSFLYGYWRPPESAVRSDFVTMAFTLCTCVWGGGLIFNMINKPSTAASNLVSVVAALLVVPAFLAGGKFRKRASSG